MLKYQRSHTLWCQDSWRWPKIFTLIQELWWHRVVMLCTAQLSWKRTEEDPSQAGWFTTVPRGLWAHETVGFAVSVAEYRNYPASLFPAFAWAWPPAAVAWGKIDTISWFKTCKKLQSICCVWCTAEETSVLDLQPLTLTVVKDLFDVTRCYIVKTNFALKYIIRIAQPFKVNQHLQLLQLWENLIIKKC